MDSSYIPRYGWCPFGISLRALAVDNSFLYLASSGVPYEDQSGYYYCVLFRTQKDQGGAQLQDFTECGGNQGANHTYPGQMVFSDGAILMNAGKRIVKISVR